jgi:hypothetical protein
MRLPAGGFNQLGKCGAVRPLEQIQQLLGLAALAGTRFLLGSFGRLCALWRLLGWGGLLPDLGLEAATRASVRQTWPFSWPSARRPGRQLGR